MFHHYHQEPILGMYYFPDHSKWGDSLIERDLSQIALVGIRAVWLFYDRYYADNEIEKLRQFLDKAHSHGLKIVPVLGLFLRLEDHPDVKIVNADGSTSDDPRYWNMGCFRNPKVFELAEAHAKGFFRDFADHPALYQIEGLPVMSFVHEAYYRNSVPEFGGGPMQPNCYCPHCRAAFRTYLVERGFAPDTEPPQNASDPGLWQHWINCHAEAIPDFLRRLIAATKAQTPLWATHECNDFYPASWQSVYTGNDFWRMGAVLDFGHEDMYPLEFDHRYQCYVYDYTKDVMRSAMGFEKLITANGQAFNSWAGHRLPENSMSEQVYSCLAHGALGLAWWGEWRGPDPDKRYEMLRQTARPNAEYLALVRQLEGFELERAPVALLYAWTTMSQALNDEHTYDTLLTYMMLIQSGYPVDLLSEAQIEGGLLESRGYKALGVMGAAALPQGVQRTIDAFVVNGGLLLTDYAPSLNETFPPIHADWRSTTKGAQPRVYTLSDGTPVPVQLDAARLTTPADAEILARFEDGTPAICRIARSKGQIVLIGSYLGWDYTNYPGYYDLAAMFPFHIRRDEVLRRWLSALLRQQGIAPTVCSVHPDVETALWLSADRRTALVLVINHLQENLQTSIQINLSGQWQVCEALTGQPVTAQYEPGKFSFPGAFTPLEGRAYRLNID